MLLYVCKGLVRNRQRNYVERRIEKIQASQGDNGHSRQEWKGSDKEKKKRWEVISKRNDFILIRVLTGLSITIKKEGHTRQSLHRSD